MTSRKPTQDSVSSGTITLRVRGHTLLSTIWRDAHTYTLTNRIGTAGLDSGNGLRSGAFVFMTDSEVYAPNSPVHPPGPLATKQHISHHDKHPQDTPVRVTEASTAPGEFPPYHQSSTSSHTGGGKSTTKYTHARCTHLQKLLCPLASQHVRRLRRAHTRKLQPRCRLQRLPGRTAYPGVARAAAEIRAMTRRRLHVAISFASGMLNLRTIGTLCSI